MISKDQPANIPWLQTLYQTFFDRDSESQSAVQKTVIGGKEKILENKQLNTSKTLKGIRRKANEGESFLGREKGIKNINE